MLIPPKLLTILCIDPSIKKSYSSIFILNKFREYFIANNLYDKHQVRLNQPLLEIFNEINSEIYPNYVNLTGSNIHVPRELLRGYILVTIRKFQSSIVGNPTIAEKINTPIEIIPLVPNSLLPIYKTNPCSHKIKKIVLMGWIRRYARIQGLLNNATQKITLDIVLKNALDIEDNEIDYMDVNKCVDIIFNRVKIKEEYKSKTYKEKLCKILNIDDKVDVTQQVINYTIDKYSNANKLVMTPFTWLHTQQDATIKLDEYLCYLLDSKKHKMQINVTTTYELSYLAKMLFKKLNPHKKTNEKDKKDNKDTDVKNNSVDPNSTNDVKKPKNTVLTL